MKKYLLGIFAVLFAVGLMSFKPAQKAKNDVFYWYDKDTGLLIEPSPSEEPANGCVLRAGDLCAFGHSSPTSTPEVDPDIEAYYP